MRPAPPVAREPAAVSAWPTAGCPVCEAPAAAPFFAMSGIPVQDGVLCPTPELAARFPLGEISLTFCAACGHVWNAAYNPDNVRFGPDYDHSLHHSPFYRAFVDALTDRLIARYGLRGKTIVEIGAGNGDFLLGLCARGGNRGFGFDPSYRGPATVAAGAGEATFIRDFYSARHAERGGDLVCCRHALQQMTDPRGFLRTIRRALGDRRDATVYVEVPDVAAIIRDGAVWNIMYEQGSHYSRASLVRLFTLGGFDVRDAAPCFEGQYLGIEAGPAAGPTGDGPDPANMVGMMAAQVAAFGEMYRRRAAEWRDRLAALARDGRRPLAWGAGGRAITFLNALGVREQIPYVVDVNPQRQGAYLPGTGQRVVAPDFLRDYRPDVVIITNCAFEGEIRRQVRDLDLACDFLVA